VTAALNPRLMKKTKPITTAVALTFSPHLSESRIYWGAQRINIHSTALATSSCNRLVFPG